MNKDQKASVVDEIAAQIESAEAVFAVDYRGISVPHAAELRARLRDADASFRVVKNSLTERAADKAGADALRQLLEGPTALTFVRGDAAVAAKAISDFARISETLEFKGGLMGGAELTIDEIKTIARLPARAVLDSQLVGIVASPLTGLVRGLNGLIAGLAVQLRQVADQGLLPEGEAQAEADEPAAEPEEPAAEADEPAAPAEEPAAEAEEPAAEETAEAADAAGGSEEPPSEEADPGEAPGETSEEPAEVAEPEEQAEEAEADASADDQK